MYVSPVLLGNGALNGGPLTRMLAKPVLPAVGATGWPRTLRLCALLALLEGGMMLQAVWRNPLAFPASPAGMHLAPDISIGTLANAVRPDDIEPEEVVFLLMTAKNVVLGHGAI